MLQPTRLEYPISQNLLFLIDKFAALMMEQVVIESSRTRRGQRSSEGAPGDRSCATGTVAEIPSE